MQRLPIKHPASDQQLALPVWVHRWSTGHYCNKEDNSDYQGKDDILQELV